MANIPPPVTQTNDRDHYNAKPPIFNGDRFDYRKDRIERFYLGHDIDLWDIVVDGYIYPVDASGNKVERRVMPRQKKDYKNHHKARTILLNAISYNEYENITNKDTAKSIFYSLRMTHEGNTQVKETNSLALIKKYEAFKMEDEETVENMFLRFQTLVVGLKLSKDLNNTSLGELVSSLRSHEIELEEDEPKRKRKYVALKSLGIYEKTKSLQVETGEDSEKESEEDDELSLLFRRVNQLWKKRQGRFRGQRRTCGHSDSNSGFKKVRAGKELMCFECKEPCHFKNEHTKLMKDKPKKNFRGKKKVLMATCLSKVLDKYQKLLDKYKDMKKIHVSESESYCKLPKDFSSLSEENLILKNNNSVPKSKSLKPEKKILSKVSTGYGDIINKYDKSFYKCLARSLNRSLMASMIYGVSRNRTRGVGYDSDEESDSQKR
ncbi:uncharacterized protein LOC127080086 [Lathyrus oleraceus]|uniref:uncharacterized protein LOC127080086 n=1 Tax=Pisum sativum TaxID=3888 RepID=UPI0021D1031D|nr:uncharacterized protein LOC127080086 [Pisum sativum]